MRLLKILFKEKRGQALVELALVLPLIIMLVMGTMEFGRIFHSYLLITNGSREGARAGVTGSTDIQIKDRVKAVTGSLGLDDSQIVITPPEISRTRGVPLTVQVDYSVPLITPLIDIFVSDPFPLTASTTMRVE